MGRRIWCLNWLTRVIHLKKSPRLTRAKVSQEEECSQRLAAANECMTICIDPLG